MRHFTIFLGIAVAATAILAVLAAPSSFPVEFTRNNMKMDRLNGNNKNFDHQIRSIISLRNLLKVETRDSFSDLIERQLGQTPTAFLSEVDRVFKVVDQMLKEGSVELDKAYAKADASLKAKITAIQRNAIAEGFKLTERFIGDLSRVLFGMPRDIITRYDPIADVIRSILCKTLQQFVETIHSGYQEADALLMRIINDVLDLADGNQSEVGTILRDVANRQLYGRTEVTSMLHKLSDLLNYRRTMMKRFNILLSESHEKRSLLDATVLSVFGFSAQTAAYQADVALSELIPLIESGRDQLNEAVASLADTEVRTKVIGIYNTSMDKFIADVTPMYRSIIDLQGTGCNSTYVYDLIGSLPGIGMDYFTNYLQRGTSQMESNLKAAFAGIQIAANEGGEETALKVSKVLEKQARSLELISEPLMETLKPVLEKKGGKNTDMAMVKRLGGDGGNWLQADGAMYNRDALVHAVSKELNFDVNEGAIALRTSLQNVDDIMGVTLIQLDAILSNHNVDIHSEILGILNETMIGIHVASQPMLNVLLPCIPDGLRSNKHIALDIFTGISGIDDIDEFTAYCAAAAKQIVGITDLAMNKIKIVAEKVAPEVGEDIESLISTALNTTKAYMKPFLDVIRPILSPNV